jgi:short-subunit dehydrogenase/acetyltransferase-like isoleucine patch superfamily enzyme
MDIKGKKNLDLKELKGYWALVTGASAGIGQEFCKQLAQAGVNVVLVARRENLLQSLAEQLQKDHQIRCLTIPVNLGDDKVAGKIKGILNENNIKIRLLVNNAGVNFYGKFSEMPRELTRQMVQVNAVAISSLCFELLEDLRSHPTSALINISSQAALNPIPGSALYAATKAFVHSLSLSLYEELKDSSVLVQTLIPGTTESESTKKSNALFKNIKEWGNPRELVQKSLNHLATGEPIVTSAKGVYIQKLFVNLMPIEIVLQKVASMFVQVLSPLLNWRDWLFTALIEIILLFVSFIAASTTHHVWGLGLFADVLVFYMTFIVSTLITLKIIRTIFPPQDGTFTLDEHPQTFYIWRLMGFLSMTNLSLNFQNNLLPSAMRKFLTRMLGAKIGKGNISITGMMIDPYAITIEDDAHIGTNVLLIPNRLTMDTLIRKHISIGRGAVIGPRCIINLGVTVGEGALVEAMSVLDENTTISPYEIWGGIPARKIGERSRLDSSAPATFFSWRDIVISPMVELMLLGISGYGSWFLGLYLNFGFFGGCILFYVLLAGLTLITLQLMRWAWPFREGQYSFKKDPWICYRWNLQSFLCEMNFFIYFHDGLLSSQLRQFFMRMLGAKLKNGGSSSKTGICQDPSLVELDRGSIFSQDSLILGHALNNDNHLLLSPVKVGPNVVIGARSVIMPGVSLGQGSRVEPLSLVTTGTIIHPREIWSGIPARKVGEIQRPNADQLSNRNLKTGSGDIINIVTAKIGVFTLATLGTIWLSPLWWGDGFCFLILFHMLDVLITLVFLAFLRRVFAFKPGTYQQKDHPNVIRRWRLYEYFCNTNLGLYYFSGLLPIQMRIIFLRLMGARVHMTDILSVGLVLAPHMVKLGRNFRIGLDALIIPCQQTDDSLLVGTVELEEQVRIGYGAVILPNVTIGEGAVVESMSLVMPGTSIPPFETWGGIPAQKRGMFINSSSISN